MVIFDAYIVATGAFSLFDKRVSLSKAATVSRFTFSYSEYCTDACKPTARGILM